MPDRNDPLETIAERFRAQLATTIAHSDRSRARMKLGAFLESFGYTASARVRQTSLRAALDNLHEWGYEEKRSGDTVNDTITISKREKSGSAAAPHAQPSAGNGSDAGVVAWKDGVLDLPVDPLTFGFHLDDARTGEDSAALWRG